MTLSLVELPACGADVFPATILDDVRAWFARFVAPMHPRDLDLLTLWTAHTHLLPRLYSTPRLLIDSPVPGSGKTTVLEHVQALAADANISTGATAASLARLPAGGPVTILLDEVDRLLRPGRDGTDDLLATVNGGYKRSGRRLVNLPTADGKDWTPVYLPTFAAVAMAGNAPALPDDTRSRCVSVLLLPARPGDVESTDWQWIEAEAAALRDRLAEWAAGVVLDERPVLPACVQNRAVEKWRPLMSVAVAAGGRWPSVCAELAEHETQRIEEEREADVMTEKPTVALVRHIADVWPQEVPELASADLVERLVMNYPDSWGDFNPHTRRRLTVQGMGRMLSKGYGILTRQSPTGNRARAYHRLDFAPALEALGIEGESC